MKTATRERQAGRTVAATLFAGYKRWLSPLLHSMGLSRCRFLPTCSEYAAVAVERHGWWRGGVLALWRVLRCGPWTKGGVDPVPARCAESDS